jgi:hypothetical protein
MNTNSEESVQGSMRGHRARRLAARAAVPTAILGAVSALVLAWACAGPVPDTCGELGTCGTADAGTTSADARTDGSCDPTLDPRDQPCVLDDTYGVFVAAPPDADGGVDAGEAGIGSGNGTAASPFATIGQALANLGGKTRIYICSGAYREQVTLQAAVSLYGGLSCAADGGVWSYAGSGTQVTSPSPAYALSVRGVDAGTVTIEDVSFASPDATEAGASSIAALIASSAVHLQRVTLAAGNGANGAGGADGVATPNYVGAAPDGGLPVTAATPSNGYVPISGGGGGVNQCLLFGASAGGDGGLGCEAGPESPGLGTPGTATPAAPVTTAGRDGLPAGATLEDGGADAGVVPYNDPGADGLAGAGGVAAAAPDYGTLSPSGWVPSPGGDGQPGDPGQGGAGATDPLYGFCGASIGDIGGGGGGAGGCGGAGGQGGSGGGASIALAALASAVELTSCTLIAADGGTGGAGGAGQDGQAGGAGAGNPNLPVANATGAAGGNGAGGSGGAGGPGGISVGLLESGSTVMTDMPTESTSLGAPGAGGAAGTLGRHGAGMLTTGVDGNPGASGNAGTSVAVLSLM